MASAPTLTRCTCATCTALSDAVTAAELAAFGAGARPFSVSMTLAMHLGECLAAHAKAGRLEPLLDQFAGIVRQFAEREVAAAKASIAGMTMQ